MVGGECCVVGVMGVGMLLVVGGMVECSVDVGLCYLWVVMGGYDVF